MLRVHVSLKNEVKSCLDRPLTHYTEVVSSLFEIQSKDLQVFLSNVRPHHFKILQSWVNAWNTTPFQALMTHPCVQ